VIQQKFERDKTARDYKYSQRTAEDEQIRKQQEEDRKMAYIDSMGGINRDDPSAAITSLAKLGIIDDNADPDKYYNAVFPHMQRNSTNLGDRMLMETFDPGTGRAAGQEYGVGLAPDIKYAQDAATMRERISQAGQNSRNAMNLPKMDELVKLKYGALVREAAALRSDYLTPQKKARLQEIALELAEIENSVMGVQPAPSPSPPSPAPQPVLPQQNPSSQKPPLDVPIAKLYGEIMKGGNVPQPGAGQQAAPGQTGPEDPITWLDPAAVQAARANGATDAQIRAWAINARTQMKR
jgi:hypothetical protein